MKIEENLQNRSHLSLERSGGNKKRQRGGCHAAGEVVSRSILLPILFWFLLKKVHLPIFLFLQDDYYIFAL